MVVTGFFAQCYNQTIRYNTYHNGTEWIQYVISVLIAVNLFPHNTNHPAEWYLFAMTLSEFGHSNVIPLVVSLSPYVIEEALAMKLSAIDGML